MKLVNNACFVQNQAINHNYLKFIFFFYIMMNLRIKYIPLRPISDWCSHEAFRDLYRVQTGLRKYIWLYSRCETW